MKTIDGSAHAVVDKEIDECFALLRAVDRYPTWIGELVPSVEVLQRGDDGQPATARIAIHVARSPLRKDFDFVGSVDGKPNETVVLSRIPNSPSDGERLEINWRLEPADRTRIRVTFHAATPRLPGFVPIGGVGDEIAATLLGAAVRALTGGNA